MSRLRGQSVAVCLAGVLLCASQAGAQAAGNWNTARGDAAHEGWQKVETELSPDSIAGKFKFLWKIKLGQPSQGPVDFSELARLAASRAGVRMGDLRSSGRQLSIREPPLSIVSG